MTPSSVVLHWITNALSLVVTLWWLLFFTAVGLSLGSFLNVVIYRLPLGLALSNPRWSFCPHCRNRIAWYDNLPVLGYLRLRGRCRNCWAPISPQYPLVELMTAMVVLILFDAFFIHGGRAGLSDVPDLNWRISEDWPIYIAHVILLVSLFAMSAIDLQYYWIDIRFTHLAALAGVVLHTLWTPVHSRTWNRPLDATAVGAMAALAGFGFVWLLLPQTDEAELNDREADDDGHNGSSGSDVGLPTTGEPEDREDADHTDRLDKTDDTGRASDRSEVLASCYAGRSTESDHGASLRLLSLVVPLAVIVFLLVSMACSSLGSSWSVPYAARVWVPLGFMILIVLREASRHRETDVEVADAIETEACGVRVRTLRELATLLPGIALGAIALWLVVHDTSLGHTLVAMVHWRPLANSWQPVFGAATAISGYVIAAGIGWCIRIVANLMYGKEAFATGDIHMMAAAGAVAGWQTVAIGFMVTCLLAMVAWLAMLPFKKSHVIPLGPWLTFGFVIAVVFYDPIVKFAVITRFIAAANMLFFENSQILPLG